MSAFTLAHLSDLHVTPIRVRRPLDFLNKRFLGALSWSLRRRKEYRPEVLAALVDDLHAQGPDHVVVTGDLTNIALQDEFSASLPWLQKLGGPQRVSVIPGNHDTYTHGSESFPWAYWEDYMRSSIPTDTLPDPAMLPPDFSTADFPTLRICGPLALVGVSTARATLPFYASGTIGQTQLDRLERLLSALGNTPLGSGRAHSPSPPTHRHIGPPPTHRRGGLSSRTRQDRCRSYSTRPYAPPSHDKYPRTLGADSGCRGLRLYGDWSATAAALTLPPLSDRATRREAWTETFSDYSYLPRV